MSETLRLTPFEELMLYHDSTAYPNACFVRLRFKGRLNQSVFQSVAGQALARHPLLSALVEKPRGRPTWRILSDPIARVHWSEEVPSEAFPKIPVLDLKSGGIRFWGMASNQASDLVVQFHHACCDGLGIFQFLNDLLLLYAAATQKEGSKARLSDLDPKLLTQRGSFGLTFSKFMKLIPKQSVGLLGVRQFLMRKPVPIVPHARESTDAPTPASYPAVLAYHFDKETSNSFRARAKRLGVTTNDLFVRDLMLAIREFRLQKGVNDDQQWIRMMIPVSLRRSGDRRLPASNVVSSVFLDRRGVEINDPEPLLRGITEEMNLIKDRQLGLTFIFSLFVNRYLPGGLRKAAKTEQCKTSVVLTNLGKLFARVRLPRDDGRLICGDVLLEKLEMLAPTAPLMAAAFAIGWYADRLSISLHYDQRPLTTTDAQDLLSLFVAQVGSPDPLPIDQ